MSFTSLVVQLFSLRLAPAYLPNFFSNWHLTITSCLLALFLKLSCEKHMKGLEFLQVKERAGVSSGQPQAYLGEEDQLRPSSPLLRCGALLVPSCPFSFVQEELKSCPTQFQDCSLVLDCSYRTFDNDGDASSLVLVIRFISRTSGQQSGNIDRVISSYPRSGVSHPWLSVCVRLCPSAHKGRPWLSISTHISMLVLGLSTLALPVDCLGDFGSRGLSVQYTQDVRGCPPAHTGRPWLSVSTHRTSVAVRVCPCVSISTHRTSVGERQHTHGVRVCPSAHTGRPWLTLAFPMECLGDFGPRGLSLQYTQDVRGGPPAHTGRLWLSVSTHRTSVAVRVCLWVSVCIRQHTQDVCGCPSVNISASWSLDSTRWPFPWTVRVILSHVGCVQYTQDVHGCPPAHTGRPWLSVSTHRTSVAVRVCLCVSVSTHRTSVAVHQYTYHHAGRPWVSASTHRTSVVVRQHTQNVCGCPSAHTGRPWLSVCLRVCPPAHTGRLWLSISTHINTLVLGLSTLALPLDCSGDFCPRGLSVQYTQDVCGCSSAHTGRPCESVSTHRTSVSTYRTSVAVRVYLSAHTQSPWLSISTHISTFVLGLSTLTLPEDYSGDFGPRGLYVLYTHDVCGCPAAHTGRPWMSHTQDVCGCPSVHLSARWCLDTARWPFPWTVWVILAHVDCLFSTHRTAVGVRQHTQDVRGCPSAHTGHPWLSVCVRQHTQDVRGCPSLHISSPWSLDSARWTFPWIVWVILAHMGCLFSTHRTSVGVRQHTQDVCGCSSAHTGGPWLSVSTHMTSVAVRVCPCVSVSTHRTSVAVHQYTYQHAGPWTQHAGPSPHTGRPWLSVCVRVCPPAHTGRPWLSVSTHINTLVLGLSTLALPVDCSGDFGPRGLSVQYTQDVRGCSSAHTGPHTGSPWLSINKHISTLVFGLSTLTLPVDCSGDFGPRGLYVLYTPDVCGCPAAHTGRPVAVRVCQCLSVSTHMKSVAVHQYTYQHVGPWTQHADPSCGLTHRMSVAVHQYTYQHVCPWTQHADPSRGLFGTSVDVRVCPSAHIGRPWVYVSTLGVRVCPSAHTGHLWLSVCVRVCPSAHTGRLWLSISTLISTTAVGVRQHTQDVRGCPSAHTGHPWLSVCVRQHTQDVRGCPSLHISSPWSLDSARWTFPWIVWVILAHMGCLFSTHRTSVGVRQHTQDVCGCSSAHTGGPWLSVSTHMTSVAVRVCPCVSVSTHRTSVAVHQYTYQHAGPWTQHAGPSPHTGRPWLSVCVRVCPPAHTGRPWLSVSTHINTLVLGLSTLALPVDCSGDFGPRGLSVQYTQDVRGCSSAHTGPHTGSPWLSINKHISTLVFGLSTLTLPVDCSGVFGPRGLYVLYTPDVCGCPAAHTGRPVAVRVCQCLSVSTHMKSVAVHQYTYQHVGPWTQHADPSCGLTHRMSVAVHQYTYKHVGPWTQHAGPSRELFGTHRTSVAVRVCPWLSVCVRGCPCVSVFVPQHTPEVCGCPSLHISARWTSVGVRQDTLASVAVRVCPSAHTGRPWLSISTHISTLVLGLSTLALPVDCLGDFGPRGRSVQYTQDVRGCPPAHIGLPWLSVAVRQHTQDVRGCTSAHIGCPSVYVSTHRTSVCVCQHTQDVCGCLFVSVCVRRPTQEYTQDVRGCPPAHTGLLWLSVSTHRTSMAVRVCPSVHTRCSWLSISTHISTLVLGLSMLALPVDCSGDFGPRGLSVQYTKDIRGCTSAHTGRSWLSVCVRVCPSAHTRCLWLSISTHISTLALPVDCSGDFGPRGLSVQYTQDVRGCTSAHTGHLCMSVSTHRTSVAVRVCPCVSVSPHKMSVAVHQYTYQHYTQDVCGCPPAHTGHPWLSVPVRQHTQDVRGCSCVSVFVRVCPSAHTGRLWLCISTHIITLVLGLSTLDHPMDCLDDFGPRGLSVQYTQDVRGCPSVGVRQHTQNVCRCLWLSVTTHRTSLAVRVCPCVFVRTHRTSVAAHQYTYQHAGPWTKHAGPSHGLFRTSVGVRQDTLASVAVRVCPSAHTGRPWLSISTHISTLVLGLSTLALPVDCLGDFGPRGRSVQYTQDVRGCPPAHIGLPWLSVAIRQHTQDVRGCTSAHIGCPSVYVSTHRTSVCVCQHTQDVCGCLFVSVCVHHPTQEYTQDVRGCPPAHTGLLWLSVSTHRTSMAVRVCPSVHTRCSWLSISTHISTLVLGLSMLALPVDCSGDFGPRGLSVQYTKDIRGCTSAHTGRSWLSVCVRVCPSAHTRCLWLSINTHISTLVLGLNTLALPVDCSGDFGPRGLSVQYTQDVRGCTSAHTGHLCMSVSTHRTSVAVRVCPCVSVSPHKMSVAVHQYTYQHYTQDVCGCPPAHTGHPWLSVPVRQHTQDVRGCSCVSVFVRVCPSAHTGRLWLCISTHIITLVLGLSTLDHPMDCLDDFGPRGLSVQYTQDVRGCPSVGVRQHTQNVCRCLWLSVTTHRTSLAVRVCPCVFVSTHRTSVAAHQYTYQHAGPWTKHAGPSRRLFRISVCVSVTTHMRSVAVHLYTNQHVGAWLSTLALPVNCLGDFGARGCLCSTHRRSVGVRQHTQDFCGCPSAHTGRPWLSVCVRQNTQYRGCPSVHISARWSLDSACWPFMWTVRVILAHVGCLFSAHRTFVGVRHNTQDFCGCPSAHTGHPWLSVCVRVCPSAHTRCLWLSISTHISTLVLGLSTLALPVDCSGDFGPRGLSVQYTQDVRGCTSAHTGHLCMSVSTHRTSLGVRVCPCVSVCVRQHTHDDVRGCPPAHTGHPWLSVPVRKHTQDVRSCPCVSVFVRVCPSSHTGRSWLCISTHIITMVLGLSTLDLPMDCLDDFGPRGLSVQYTQDVRGCPSAHTGRLWLFVAVRHHTQDVLGCDFGPRGLSVQYTQDVRGCLSAHTGHPSAHTGHPCVSVSTHRTSVAIRVCPSGHTGRPSLSISTHISTLVLGLSTLTLPVDCLGDFVPRGLFSTHKTSVGVRLHTQDVCCCPCVSVCVCLCPSAHTGHLWLSISTHISTLVLGLSTLALPVDCSGDFWPTWAVCSVHTGRPWVSAITHRTSVAVRVCPCVSVSTHRTSVAVHLYTYQHAGPWTQHAGPSLMIPPDRFSERSTKVKDSERSTMVKPRWSAMILGRILTDAPVSHIEWENSTPLTTHGIQTS
ncbi:hypothetical protein IGI04_035949 [Brassica rapa subsp. trilocularis]|uniref:EGF-like domain-containing protein n=1 Tax=Brassica rapa subsp. trilocularis TaxID=1813537 RepID=A0ABQ7LG16_BRACM|nr:hypothetical protein IGI04_035949 [Brassica rapa subsp. trilocularis]